MCSCLIDVLSLQQDWDPPSGEWGQAVSREGQIDLSKSPASPMAEGHQLSGAQQSEGSPSSFEGSPDQMHDRPDGVASDDNFEVSDDADEQQVMLSLRLAQVHVQS